MKLTLKLSLGAMLLGCLLFLNSCKKKVAKVETQEIAESYNKVSSDSLCESSWFPHNQTPAPEEGEGSPFDVSSTTNAIFHQWSWQKFLWLTKPTTEVTLLPIITRGEPTPIVLKVKIPLFLNPKKMHQVTSHMQMVSQKDGAALVLTDTLQAGSSGVLKTNPAYNKKNISATVFYSIHVSPIMKTAAEKFKDSIISGKLAKDNLSAFPVGSLELKVSWVAKDAIAEDEINNYYTTVAAVTRDGKTYTNTEVALLGMHVVGVVENHPEFIWATFEHDDLAPNYNWDKGEASASEDKLLFAKGTTRGITGITWDKTGAKEPYKAFDLFQYGVPKTFNGDLMNTSQEEPTNITNIENINSCVKQNLDDVWKNYFYNGSIWIDTDGFTPKQQSEILVGLRGAVSNAYPGSFARGSLNCANVTMETYTQTFKNKITDINVGNLANCFSCHNAVSYTNNSSPIYISHLFDAYIKNAEGKTFDQIELLKAKQELEEFTKNNLQ